MCVYICVYIYKYICRYIQIYIYMYMMYVCIYIKTLSWKVFGRNTSKWNKEGTSLYKLQQQFLVAAIQSKHDWDSKCLWLSSQERILAGQEHTAKRWKHLLCLGRVPSLEQYAQVYKDLQRCKEWHKHCSPQLLVDTLPCFQVHFWVSYKLSASFPHQWSKRNKTCAAHKPHTRFK